MSGSSASVSVSSGDESLDEQECPVTEEWLTAVLASHLDTQVQVDRFTVRPGCDQGESVLSDILAVNVDYTDTVASHSLSLIVKLLPQDPFSRYFVTEAQFDLREIKFYTKVAPDLLRIQKDLLADGCEEIELPIPKCLHARYNADNDSVAQSVLVLENLKVQGYSSCEFSQGLTLQQAQSALEAIARLHALSLVLKVKQKLALDEKYPFLFQTARASDSYQQLVERGLPQLAHFLQRRPGLESVLQCLSALTPNTKDIIAALLAPEEPLCLITHTDFWCNNLLFREDGQCAVLDWQMVTYSRPTNDVALLLVSSLSTELRRTHTETLLDAYWAALNSYSSRLQLNITAELGYDRQNLSKDFRRSLLLALLLCIGSVDVALGDPLTEQRLLDVLHDLHTDGILSTDVLDQ
ncbi:uncharacterized protein LOC124362856 [Homalodisca vitripennis]|nr:uncharacterized protein LOC124362856 [Homalodisca vitripennis]